MDEELKNTIAIVWLSLCLVLIVAIACAYNYYSDKLYVEAHYTRTMQVGNSMPMWSLPDSNEVK